MDRNKVTVWMGLVGNGVIIGPLFFDRNVNGQSYIRMLDNDVVPYLKQHFQRQLQGVFTRLWWAQDGAPAHRLRAVTDRLTALFGDRVIALNRPTEWPPKSPDLTPCDFFLWGYLKNKVYEMPVRDLAEMRARITREVMVSGTIQAWCDEQ